MAVVVTKVSQTGRSDRFLYHRAVGLPETEVRHSETQLDDLYTAQFLWRPGAVGSLRHVWNKNHKTKC